MTPLILIAAAAVLLARIGLELHLDTRRAWAETLDREHDEATGLPRRTPVENPEDAEQIGRPPLDVVERVLAGLKRDATWRPAKPGETPGQLTPELAPDWPWSAWTTDLEPGLAYAWHMPRPEPTGGQYRPRHSKEAETPTEQFAAIVDASLTDLATWCTLCEAGDHGDCPGCACPCGLPADELASAAT